MAVKNLEGSGRLCTESERAIQLLVAHLALMFAVKLLFPNLDLFFLLVGASLSGFDAFLPILRLEDEDYHCGSVFHSVWLPLAGALVLLTLNVAWSTSFLTGGLLHLLTDSADVRGRPWLYPLSKKTFGVAIFPYDFKDYVSNPLCVAIEVASILLIIAYVHAFGVDLLSSLWFALLLPLFGVFVLHQWRRARNRSNRTG